MESRSSELGVDSLVSVDIRSWFLKHLHVNLPVLKIMGNNTMASLVQHAFESLSSELAPGMKSEEGSQDVGYQNTIENSSEELPAHLVPSNSMSSISTTPPEPADIETRGMMHSTWIDWSLESSLPLNAIEAPCNSHFRPILFPPRVIVLTGCTGLLGHHLLSHILAQPTVEKIICLSVRSLTQRLKHSRLLEDPRIIYHGGDLAHPLLGLSEEVNETIFAETDAVIHNGADTSHLKHYVDLLPANVYSTMTLARLCLRRRIPLHYVSSAGLGIFHENGATEGFPPGAIKPPPGMSPNGSFGYACSKWTCEMFLERMSEEHRMRVFIHRPSTIVREGEDAIGPEAEKDWINAFLVYVKKLKAVPTTKRKQGALDLVYVRSVCDGIIRHLFNSNGSVRLERGVTYVNYVGDEVLPLDNLQDLGLQDQGVPYDVIMQEEWMAAATAAGMHPGVATLIGSMVEGGEQYPKLLKGESTSLV